MANKKNLRALFAAVTLFFASTTSPYWFDNYSIRSSMSVGDRQVQEVEPKWAPSVGIQIQRDIAVYTLHSAELIVKELQSLKSAINEIHATIKEHAKSGNK